MKKFSALILGMSVLTPLTAFAQDIGTALGVGFWHSPHQLALMFAFAGAALATALPCIGSSRGITLVGQAGTGLLTEKPALAGRVIVLMVLPGSNGLYGMVISLLFLFTILPTITDGTITLSIWQGLSLFAAFLPIAITGLLTGVHQAKICATGMHMLARDGALTGRVITMASLVETYVLLGFLISFFMLQRVADSILAVGA